MDIEGVDFKAVVERSNEIHRKTMAGPNYIPLPDDWLDDLRQAGANEVNEEVVADTFLGKEESDGTRRER